jgi:hypothetical protein
MKHAKFINFKAVSEELTESKTKIQQSNTALKYVDILNNLDDFIEIWLKRSKRTLNPAPKQKIKRNTSGLRRGNNRK